MVRGIVYGGATGLALSALLLVTVSLLVPVPPHQVAGNVPDEAAERPRTLPPTLAPRDQSEPQVSAPSRPGRPEVADQVAAGADGPARPAAPSTEPVGTGFGTGADAGDEPPLPPQADGAQDGGEGRRIVRTEVPILDPEEPSVADGAPTDSVDGAARTEVALADPVPMDDPDGAEPATETPRSAPPEDAEDAAAAASPEDAPADVPDGPPESDAPERSVGDPAPGSIAIPANSQFARPREDGEVVTPDADARPRVAVSTAPDASAGPGAVPAADTLSAARPGEAEIAALAPPPDEGAAPYLPPPLDEGAPRTFRAVELDDATAPGEDAPEADAAPSGAVPADPDEVPEDQAPEEGGGTVTTLVVPVEPAGPTPAPDNEVPSEAPSEAGAPEAVTPAIEANAAAFDNPEGLPLLSVVLIDEPASGVARADLAAIDLPVAFAIDPGAPDAEEAIALYREAGHEVVLRVDGSDADGIDAGAAAELGAVALLGARAEAFPALAAQGLGVLADPDAADPDLDEARAAGLPAAAFYRDLDAEGERASTIVRFLDRATFEAEQDGTAVVIGRTSPEMVTALYSWALGRRATSVALAPVSRTLLATGDEAGSR